MKGFKSTGHGPKAGHSFGSKHGFSHSGTNKQKVSGYSRGVPKVAAKTKFATGGVVTTPQASGDSSVIKRTYPVTSFDAEHGGKSPLRPGFKKGGPTKKGKPFAEGGKVSGVGSAIKMVKELISQGEPAHTAARKAASRYSVPVSSVVGELPKQGLTPDPQMLAQGGLPQAATRIAPQAQKIPGQSAGPLASALVGRAPPQSIPRPAAAPMPVQRPVMNNQGYGSFGRRPLIGRG